MSDDEKTKLALLLKQARAGNTASLEILCQNLETTIRGYFVRKFQNNTLVDDLCQETYIRLLKNLLQIRDGMKLKSFVAKVAFHVTQDYFRKKYQKQEENLETDYSSDDVQQIKLAAEDNPDDDGLLTKVDMEDALNRLPEKSRRIIMLKSQGYNYEEISAEVGLTVSGVKMQVKRTMEQLRFTLLVVTFLLISATLLINHL